MQYLKPGTVVAVAVGPIDHVGIVTDRIVNGYQTVISASQKIGHVAEEVLPEFSNGQMVRVLGYLGKLAPMVVLRRARSMLGKTWRLFSWNCEHFVRWAHGLRPTSPQLIKGAVILSALTIAAALAARA